MILKATVHAAVHKNSLPSHVRGAFRGQPDDGVRNLFRLRKAAKRYALRNLRFIVCRAGSGCARPDLCQFFHTSPSTPARTAVESTSSGTGCFTATDVIVTILPQCCCCMWGNTACAKETM